MALRGNNPLRTGARLRPRNWPVRWRLTAVSTALTLAILVIFGGLVGKLASERIRSDFDDEVRNGAHAIASEVQIVYTTVGTLVQRGPRISDFVLPEDASARVFDVSGRPLSPPNGGVGLGPLESGISEHDGMRVAAIQLTDDTGSVTGYVQYGRSLANVDSTINRLWLLILTGVLGGTLLAGLAGVAIASRAMRPVSALTAAARKVADTGDPSRRMPAPNADDEVGELALTLEQMLRSLEAARNEREVAMRKQREFVADASHELRTPLTSIIANLELLQASLRDPGQEDDRAVTDSALRSSQRMSRLVGDLLLLARADVGRSRARGPCDLADVVLDAAAEAAPTLGERELRIGDPSPLWIEGNPDELHRLVLNLLDNAARHTPPGTVIDLRLEKEGGDAVLTVADDGPGIPAELRERVFDRFVRGETSADTTARPGTGLGLAIVQAIATSHKGTAKAKESPQGGAMFQVRLPLANQLPEPQANRAGGVRAGMPPPPEGS